MSSDYNYDEQGQFYPFFILTIAGLITLPLTYNVFKADTNVEAAAAPAQYDYKPADEDLIQESKRNAKRRERKLKRMLAAALGYVVMAGMIYLIIVTARITPKLYDPYEVLGVSRVCLPHCLSFFDFSKSAAMCISKKRLTRETERGRKRPEKVL